MEHENGVQALNTWLTLQEDKLKKRHKIEDVASVQNALKDCQVNMHIQCYGCNAWFEFYFSERKNKVYLSQELEELVKEKEKEREKAEERGNSLIQDKTGAACSVVKETLQRLNQSWAHLDHMVSFLQLLPS